MSQADNTMILELHRDGALPTRIIPCADVTPVWGGSVIAKLWYKDRFIWRLFPVHTFVEARYYTGKERITEVVHD
jgi:hypothetical protein